MKNLIIYLKKNKFTLSALFLIFILGLFLRTYRISEFMYWGDPGRDTLVAKRIYEGGRPRFIVPYAAGGRGLLFNSPFYYNFLAVGWAIFGSAQGLALSFALINSLVIIVNYKIGEELESKELGLIIAFITAISHLAINHSRSSFQPFLLPLFFSLTILFIIRFYRTRHWINIVGSTFFFWLCFHIHYSIIPVAPVIFFLIIFSIYKYFVKSKDKLITLLLSLFFFVNFEIWFFITNSGKSLDIFNFISFHTKKSFTSGVYNLDIKNILKIFEYLFEKSVVNFTWLPLLVMSFVILGLLLKLYSLFKNKDKKLPIYLFLVISFSTLLLTVLFSLKIDPTYLMPYYYLFFILLGVIIYEISQKRKLLSIVILFFFSYHLQINNYIYFEKYPWNEFGQSKYLVSKVIEDAKENNLSVKEFLIFEKSKSMPIYNWGTPSYVYFLEDYYQVKLQELSYGFNNLSPIYKNPKVIYLVCREFNEFSSEIVQDLCVKPLIKRYGTSIAKDYQVIINKEDQATDLELYKFKIDLKTKPLIWVFN